MAKKLTLASEIDKSPFQPVDLEMITLDSVADVDLYIKNDSSHVLYKAGHLPFTLKDKQRLQDSKTHTLYLFCENERQLRSFFEKNLSTIIESNKIPLAKKADVLYKCATGIAHEIFEKPESKEAIGKSKEVVNNTIRLLSKSSDAFMQIISLSSHDYYTYTHCVNVMTFTVSLLSAMGIKDQTILKEAGAGALLHDVGKAKVPLKILNKPGPLTEEEWQVMKKHPVFGLEMLDRSPVSDRGKDIVVQHHEKITGIGYPYGLKGDQILLVSQAVSLCDAYDAMTTNRCYQKALKPFDAFMIITNEMRGHFDQRLVEKFIQILNLKKK